MTVLTDADRQMLPLALRANGGFHIATRWYLNGWDPLWYQYDFHQATQPNCTFLAGIAAGKTTATASSYLIDCITVPYFRALNTSVTAKQAELPFEMAMSWIEGNEKLNHLIESVSLRPYPTIKFKNYSEWIFRTAGMDARFIRGMEFDRINFDEAGLDFSGEAIKVLRGRLRGVRPDGTMRLGRLDVMTSPTDAPWLRERYERGLPDSINSDMTDNLSLKVTTYDNTRLTRKSIELMEAEFSDDMIDVELGANFPDYGMSMFPKSHVNACTDQSMNDAMEEALHPEKGAVKRGYKCLEHPRYGITQFEFPYDPQKQYVMGGDPGTDSPPKRNTGVVMVADVTSMPHRIVYFDWVDGRGAYSPFLSSYKYAINKYRPIMKGLDVTGTQKAIDELAFENYGIEVDGINFQKDKNAMLNCLISDITDHRFKWPVVRGLVKQMSHYSRENDSKLAQDIVMTISQISLLSRMVSGEGEEREPEKQSMPRKSASNYKRRHQAKAAGWRRRR